MNQHTPTETEPGVYRCPCGFHAVATQQGMHVIDSGIGRQLHLAAIAEQQIATRAMVEQQIKRLIEAYRIRRPIFWELYRMAWSEGWEVSATQFGAERDDGALTMRQVRRYGQYIRAEHGL